MMSKSPKKNTGLQLGRAVEWPDSPEKAKLDRVPNPQKGTNYLVRFTAPEFTSLCPVTGQPDFAHLVIDYVPGQWLLESKSLKLYVASFRNHGAFHEDCTVAIGRRIASEIKTKWLRVGGYWYPRGGIPIDVFWQTGRLPKDVWVPEQGVAPYRGRGGSPRLWSQAHLRDLAASDARVMHEPFAPTRPSREGAGNAGCPLHPQPRAQKWKA